MAPMDPGREKAILDATFDLLSEMGYDRMSVDQIARRAKASKATIYRRWAGKPELVVEVICRRFDMEVPAVPDTGSLRGDLVEVVRGLAAAAERKHGLIMGLSSTLVSHQELARTLRERMPVRDLAGATLLVERAVARGELPSAVDAGRLFEVVEALVWHRLIFIGPPLDDAFAAQAVDGVLLPLTHAWAG